MNSSRGRRRNQNSAVVRATCPTCGDVELTVASVSVQTCRDTGSSTYSFLCPACRLLVNKAATPTVVASLSTAGARVSTWALPAELAEAKVGPPISHDDILEFHLGFEADGWREELASLSANG